MGGCGHNVKVRIASSIDLGQFYYSLCLCSRENDRERKWRKERLWKNASRFEKLHGKRKFLLRV